MKFLFPSNIENENEGKNIQNMQIHVNKEKNILPSCYIVSITDGKVIVDTNNCIFSTNSSMVPGPLGPASKPLGNFDLVK